MNEINANYGITAFNPSTYSSSYPYSLLDLPSGSHGVHPATWGLFFRQVEHSLTNINDGEVSLAPLPRPCPEGVALSTRLQVVCKDWTGVDGVYLLQRLVSGSANGVATTKEPRLTYALDNLW